MVWGCFPRFDGDPAFCSLLRGHAGDAGAGVFTVDVLDHARTEQAFLENTPILITRKYDARAAASRSPISRRASSTSAASSAP